MASLNSVHLIGRLGKEPDLSYTSSGKAVCKFSMATSEKWKDGDGNVQEKTDWHNIVVWQKLAEICGQYLKKGSQVFIGGKISTRSWDDKNSGTKKYITEIVANEMMMLDGKGGNKASEEPADPIATGAMPEKDDLPF
jgi:single-strand DNA-binding protein